VLSTGAGDFDADSRTDFASVGAPTERGCAGLGPFTLRVDLATGGAVERRLGDCDGHCSFFRLPTSIVTDATSFSS